MPLALELLQQSSVFVPALLKSVFSTFTHLLQPSFQPSWSFPQVPLDPLVLDLLDSLLLRIQIIICFCPSARLWHPSCTYNMICCFVHPCWFDNILHLIPHCQTCFSVNLQNCPTWIYKCTFQTRILKPMHSTNKFYFIKIYGSKSLQLM